MPTSDSQAFAVITFQVSAFTAVAVAIALLVDFVKWAFHIGLTMAIIDCSFAASHPASSAVVEDIITTLAVVANLDIGCFAAGIIISLGTAAFINWALTSSPLVD